MKVLILAVLVMYGAGCETTGPKKRYQRQSSYRHASSTVKSESTATSPVKGVGGVIEGDSTGILVSPAWMETYRAREKTHGTIPADDLIWQEGENYRVNSDVINHFAEMKISDSGIKP